jgi:endonuclease/exonuclease/phosphatase family metal-dependent hydrolase
MKIISWNTFLAPTMPNRFSREPHIINKVMSWLKNDNVDVVALQEMNSYTTGPIGWLYYRFDLHKYLHPTIQALTDVLLIVEGYILPIFTYNHTTLLQYDIDDYNTHKQDDEPTITMVKSRDEYRGVNGGLVVISKYKPTVCLTIPLQSDFIHIPTSLYVKYNDGTVVINNHIVPNLPNYTIVYRVVNAVNYLFGYNQDTLQRENIDTLSSVVKYADTSRMTVVGDFNIKKRLNPVMYKYMMDELQLKDSTDGCLNTQHHINCKDGDKGHEEDQIDYILGRDTPVDGGVCRRVDGTVYLSEHHPITVDYMFT